MTSSNNLTKHPKGSLSELTVISVPLMLSALSSNLMMFLDRVILARFSTDAMTAVTAVGMVCMIFIFGVVSISSIAEVLVGQYNGAKKFKNMASPAWQMIWFSLLTFLIFIPLTFFGSDYLISEEVRLHGLPYYKWIMAFGPTMAIIAALSAFFIGQGKTTLVFWVTILGNVFNIILDIILIFGIKGIFNPMGSEGAAIATVLAQFLQILIFAIVFLNANNRKKYGTSKISFNFPEFKKCFQIGLPNAISHMIEIGAWALLLKLMADVSREHVTVLAIIISIFGLLAFTTDGLQKAIIAIASNYLGISDFKSIKKMMVSGVRLILILASLFFIPAVVYPEMVINTFISDDLASSTEIYNLTPFIKSGIFWIWIYFIFDGLTWIFAGVLTAGGDTKFGMYMNTFGAWFFAIVPIYYFVVTGTGSPSLAITIMGFYGFMNMICFFLRYKIGFWKTNKVIDN